MSLLSRILNIKVLSGLRLFAAWQHKVFGGNQGGPTTSISGASELCGASRVAGRDQFCGDLVAVGVEPQPSAGLQVRLCTCALLIEVTSAPGVWLF